MLRGEKVLLRAREEADIAILHADLHEDVQMRSRANSRPWRPYSSGLTTSPFSIAEPTDGYTPFTVVDLAGNEVAGDASLWGIDPHNRVAHLGTALRPSMRGRGLGTDVIRVLCHYGFVVLGMQRLQVDTLADNASMIGSAQRVGFQVEGTLRRAAWVNGEFLDEVVMGLLAEQWRRA
ncbi:MAG TPA: GNAT family protein [Micromonosporaceae bacterium]